VAHAYQLVQHRKSSVEKILPHHTERYSFVHLSLPKVSYTSIMFSLGWSYEARSITFSLDKNVTIHESVKQEFEVFIESIFVNMYGKAMTETLRHQTTNQIESKLLYLKSQNLVTIDDLQLAH